MRLLGSITREDRQEILSMMKPVFVEQLTIALMGSLVSMMVKSSGLAAVAAVNLLNSLIYLAQTTFVGIGSGSTVMVAQSRAQGDPVHTGHIGTQAIMIGVISSLLMAVPCLVFRRPVLRLLLGGAEEAVYYYANIYLWFNLVSLPFIAVYQVSTAVLRGAGAARISLYATLVNNGSYAVLGLGAIWLFDAGLTGVSVALLLSRAITGVYALLLLKRGTPHMLMQRVLTLHMDKTVLRPMMYIIVPICLQNMLFQGGKLITQRFSVAFGTAGIAANGICNTFEPLIEVPGATCQQSVTPVVAFRYGLGQKDEARRKAKIFVLIDVLSSTVTALIMAVLLGPLARFYSTEAAVQNEIIRIMTMSCVIIPVLHGVSWVLPAAMNGAGDVRFSSFITILSMFLMRISVGYLLTVVLRIGVIGIWIAMFSDWAFRSVCFTIRFKGTKWLNQKQA
ncbi:MAG: hypothetical protein IJP30_05275 [Clostridia bacterium]|nr:hypothetical protein [Clostridia bacterium]